MLDYISKIQTIFIEEYKFETNKKGLPKNVPDGEYPMIINGKKDNIIILEGKISCCNFDENMSILGSRRK